MVVNDSEIAALLQAVGESVEVFYEPRNVGDEWYVGLADPHGGELPLHGHFDNLVQGLRWLVRHKDIT